MKKVMVLCRKDLSDLDGQQFTKGNLYEGNTSYCLKNLKVINDSGEPHLLGNWSKHFTVI